MASTPTGTVVGYFTSETQAETAVAALKAAGFSSSHIGVAMSDQGNGAYDQSIETIAGTSHAASTGHAAGAKVASAWDRFKHFFEGSDAEPYAAEKTTDTTHSHEITGHYENYDFSESLTGLNVPEERSRYFGHRIGSQQGAVVTVSAPGREEEAEAILEQNGADLGSDTAGYDYSAPVATGQQKIQLLGEVLRVQKDRISRGEVRIRKEIITEQQTIQVPVTREELVIERIPVRGATAVAGEIGADSEIRIPLSEEVASLDKHTVVREEIAVGKRAVENVQQVGGTVRHEELNVDETAVKDPASTY
jgi:uncharacterized protein (TIGR02271 family)